jgi:AcrR family transcriptional regulator
MARRSDHSRDELKALILDCARGIAEEEGLRGLTARRIATEIGYAPGTIYNLFSNLDDLILQLRGETLDTLYDYLSSRVINGEPEAILISIAYNYINFVSKHANLWGLMFEHKLPENFESPDWYHNKSLRLLKLAENAIAAFFSLGQDEDRLHHAQILWASLHGICSVQIAGKLVKKESAELMVQSLITKYIAGLRNEYSEAERL